jgi:glutamine synthetase
LPEIEAGSKSDPDWSRAVREAVERAHRPDLRFVDLWFTDLAGRACRIAMRADLLDDRLFSSGIVLDGRTVEAAWQGLILLLPDPTAAYVDPVASAPTLAIMCDVAFAPSRESHPSDPRRALRRAQEHVRRSGAMAVLGAEVEFFLLEAGVPAAEDAVWELLRAMAMALAQAGIPVDWFRTGPGAGQGRVQMRAAPALRTADEVMLYKHVARSLAQKSGRTVTFLPKPLPGDAAAGMLVHHALWKDGKNLFHDSKGWALTSRTCRWYAGGLLKHTPALLAFCASTTNSYRRLLPGSEVPTELVLSMNRGTAACRIPAGTTGPDPATRRIKYCCADGSSNPYLALAAMLMAGLDGIENRIEAPLDESAPIAPARFPDSLEAALAALKDDTDFLKRGQVFTDALIQAWIEERWQHQVLPVRSRPHPWELRMENDS